MKTFRFLYFAATALLFAACANDNEQQGYNGPVAATITADISNNANTRATAVENTWTANDAIGVYATSTGITQANNKKYVATDADGNFSAQFKSSGFAGGRINQKSYRHDMYF